MDYVAILKAYLRAVKGNEGISFTRDVDLPPDLKTELDRIEAEVDAEHDPDALPAPDPELDAWKAKHGKK